MLERIVSFFERMVVALETIAKAPAVCAGTQPPPDYVPNKADRMKVAESASLAHNEGEAKFAKERDANNLVQQAQMPAPAPAPAPAFGNMGATDFLAPAPPTTVAPPTREAVGNALIELATVSRDKAVEVLAAFGGAQKLSQVPESEYPTLLLNINKTRAGLA